MSTPPLTEAASKPEVSLPTGVRLPREPAIEVDGVSGGHGGEGSGGSTDHQPSARPAAPGRALKIRLGAATAVCIAVPVALLLSLWSNLNLPFWYNEQWRAYYIADHGNWWQALRNDGAPFPAGWYLIERVSGDLFGTTELALRLPTAVFLPISCVLFMLLARRWMPLVPAVLLALIGSLFGSLQVFSVQLSEYQIDAAAVLMIVLMHEIASDMAADPQRPSRVYLAYAGIAVACLFSTPAIFVAGPILAFDVLRDARRRTFTVQSRAAVGAGVVALAHLGLFVVRQNALTKSPYWDSQFLPHHGLGGQLTFVWRGLESFFTGAFTSAFTPQFSTLLSPGWGATVGVVWAALVGVGVIEAARSTRGRFLLLATASPLVLTLVASYVRYWPFGFGRTNLYEVPLLLLVAGIGVAGTATRFVTNGPRQARHTRVTTASKRLAQVGRIVVLGAALFALVASCLFVITSYDQLRLTPALPAYGNEIGQAAATVRHEATGRSVVVVAGDMAIPGWRYYEDEYSGKSVETGAALPIDHELFVVQHGSPSVTRFVRRTRPSKVFLYVPVGTTGPEIQQDIDAAVAGGACSQPTSHIFPTSGMLVTLSMGPDCPA